MTCTERIKIICKEMKIPISRLEKELGFANGYIGQLRKGTMPADRLSLVADYLGTSQEYLLTGQEKPADQVADGLDKLEEDLIKSFRRLPDQMKESLIRKVQADAEFYGLPPKE